MTAGNTKWVKNPDSLQLIGGLDFNNVVSLRDEGQSWLKACNTQCSLDFSQVTNSSSAGVALIMALRRTAIANGKHLTIINLPADLLSMIRLGGLDWLLENEATEVS